MHVADSVSFYFSDLNPPINHMQSSIIMLLTSYSWLQTQNNEIESNEGLFSNLAHGL